MGKPLISDAAIRGMYRTVQRLRAARRAPGFYAGLPRVLRDAMQQDPEAVLAALLSQLHRRDTLVTEGAHPLLERALPEWFTAEAGPRLHSFATGPEACAAAAAGMALRIADMARPPVQQESNARQLPRAVVVAILRSFPPLTDVLRLVEGHELSLLLFVSGEADTRAESQRRALSTKVPVLLVDSDDAVAACRVTQECLLRARNGWGGAVIQTVSLPGAVDALTLLEQHLERRGLPVA